MSRTWSSAAPAGSPVTVWSVVPPSPASRTTCSAPPDASAVRIAPAVKAEAYVWPSGTVRVLVTAPPGRGGGRERPRGEGGAVRRAVRTGGGGGARALGVVAVRAPGRGGLGGPGPQAAVVLPRHGRGRRLAVPVRPTRRARCRH